jgi:hypothetical protein
MLLFKLAQFQMVCYTVFTSISGTSRRSQIYKNTHDILCSYQDIARNSCEPKNASKMMCDTKVIMANLFAKSNNFICFISKRWKSPPDKNFRKFCSVFLQRLCSSFLHATPMLICHATERHLNLEAITQRNHFFG